MTDTPMKERMSAAIADAPTTDATRTLTRNQIQVNAALSELTNPTPAMVEAMQADFETRHAYTPIYGEMVDLYKAAITAAIAGK